MELFFICLLAFISLAVTLMERFDIESVKSLSSLVLRLSLSIMVYFFGPWENKAYYAVIIAFADPIFIIRSFQGIAEAIKKKNLERKGNEPD